MVEVREQKCREHYGEDIWGTAQPKAKVCFDFLCGTNLIPYPQYLTLPLFCTRNTKSEFRQN
jgi:hypothetical protein